MPIQEYSGSGFIPGIPASIATAPCRIKFDDTGGILEVARPGQLFSDEVAPSESIEQVAPRRTRKEMPA
jgi:hypothetical protein